MKEEIAGIVLRFVRSILFADLVLAAVVAVACYIFDLGSLEAYGAVLTWVGTAILVFACFTVIGGFASRAEDAIAYSRSGAGNMIDNLQRIADARSSNLGCFVHLLVAALLLIGAGYVIQTIPL